MAFLHGVETIEIKKGAKTVKEVRSAVIGIVGTAPFSPADLSADNGLMLVTSQSDAAKLGDPIPGFTIPKALEAIHAQGAGTVVVVNVYDPTLHNVTETGEAQTIVNGQAALDYAPLDNLAIVNQATEPLTVDTHYTIDSYGKITFTARALNGVTEVLAEGSFLITGGTSNPGTNKLTSYPVNGVDILGAAVDWTTSNDNTAALVAAQINTYVSAPNYTAVAVGNKVTYKAVAGSGTTPNGFVGAGVIGGDVTIGTQVPMAGGVDEETASTSISADYDRFDPTTVGAVEIIGDIDGLTNERTGLKLLRMAYNTFGFRAKLIICPGFSTLASVSAEMGVLASQVKAMYIVDGPEGATPATIITSRGPAGTLNLNTSDPRFIPAFPMVKAFDLATETDELRPFSQYLAGVIAATDNNDIASYAASPSNKEIKGITGVEQLLQWELQDTSSEANLLNEVGVVCIITGFGLGFRVWGNRSAAFPSNTDPENFISVRRTADILHESVELATIQFVDKPITRAIIDSIIATVEGFMRTLEGNGRLLPGSTCTFDEADNPATEIAAGHLTFNLNFMPPTPAERITYKSFIDISLLSQLAA